MNAEPILNQDTLPTEPTHRWADDGGVLTEERQPESESVEPETSAATSDFDPDFGAAFLTFATPSILGELKRYFRDTTWAVHVPRRIQELSSELRDATETLSQGLSRAPTVDELAVLLGAEDRGIQNVIDRETLRPLLATLSAREKKILLMRFFRSMTQTEISQELGVSQMQVSRLLTGILGGLRTRADCGPR